MFFILITKHFFLSDKSKEYISSSSAGGGLRIVASGNPIVPVFNNVNIYNNYSHLAGGVYISGDINISNFDVYNNEIVPGITLKLIIWIASIVSMYCGKR